MMTSGMMTSGTSMWHVVENQIRIQLDDYGYGDVKMIADEKYSWVLYRNGDLVGKAYYDLDNIIVQIKP